MTITKYETAENGPELLNRLRVIVETGSYSKTDVAWACAVIGGQAIALASKDNPEAFAENVETFQKEFRRNAEKRFDERANDAKA